MLGAQAFGQDTPAASQAVAPPLITQPVDESQLTTLRGNTHPLARPQFDLGTAQASLPMQRMLLVLKRSPDQEAALRRLLDNQQDKASPSYHKWLTPEQFGKQFGPTDADLQTIAAWLQSHGFQVGSTKGRTVLEFSGTAGQVQEAFHTTIHKYLVNGEQHWANATDPQIPTALTPAVAGMASLNNFPRMAMNQFYGQFSRDKATGRTTPLSPLYTYPGHCDEDGNCYALGPYDFATIYNLLPLWNAGVSGQNQTIAIVGESNIKPQDVTVFRSIFGLPANGFPANPVNIVLNGPDPGIQRDESEADIDVQWSGAAAPSATIDLVVSESTETTSGVDLSAVYIVENNLAPVMSESYGFCELGLGTSGNRFFNALWQQASAQGISVFIASGDSGSAGCDRNQGTTPQPAQFGLAVSGYASTPYNVAVGGTDFNDISNPTAYWNTTNDPTTQASAKGYIPETTWNDSCTNGILASLGWSSNAETNCNNAKLSRLVWTVGGSGGTSNCTAPQGNTASSCTGGYPKPSWQAGSPNDGHRDLPDVALFASDGFMGNFYVICQSDATYYDSCDTGSTLYLSGFGGTSVSSPAFAGIMALINQQNGRQGNPNYVFYRLAAKQLDSSCTSTTGPASNCIFNDVTSGTIEMPCSKGSPNCGTTNSGDAYGVLSGYSAGTGFDLATGLGSVNAQNLVNQWSSVTSLPSVTAITTLAPTAISHGQSVSFSVNVKPQIGNGVPTGAISLLQGSGGPGIAAFPLSNGSVSGSTTLLPGGSYSVLAHYAGDATYGSSDSSLVPVTVSSEPSKTLPNLVTFGSNGLLTSFTANSATYGSGYYFFRVDVGDSAASVSSTTGISSTCANGKASCPTGKISLAASGTALDGTTLLLNSVGFAENQSFPPGSYSLTASYSGDSSYAASVGNVNFTVAQAPATTTANIYNGVPVQYGYYVPTIAYLNTTSDGVAPSGTFQFLMDGSPYGKPAPVSQSGGYNLQRTPHYAWAQALSSAAFLSVGTHTLASQFPGDINYAASNGSPSNVVVSKAQPTFTANSWNASSPIVGQTVSPSAQMYGSDAGAIPTGTMAFFDNGNTIPGNVTYTGTAAGQTTGSNLTGTISYTFTTPGTHNLTISYSGDSNYLPTTVAAINASSVYVTGPVTVTPSSTIYISNPGQSGSTTLTLTSNMGFSGNVALSCTTDPTAKESGCGFTSGSSTASTLQVNLTGASTTVTFNVTTMAPHPVAQRRATSLLGPAGFALGGVALIFLPFSHRRRRKLIAIAVVGLFLSLAACGGGGRGGGQQTDPGTPVGQYAFTVTSVTGSGSSALSLATPVSVVVQ